MSSAPACARRGAPGVLRGVALAVGLGLAACSGPPSEPGPSSDPGPLPPAPPSPPGGELLASEALEGPAPVPLLPPLVEAGVAASTPPPLVYGTVYSVDTGDGENGPSWLLLERARAPRPASEPYGLAMEHAGSWELLPIADESTPYATASVIAQARVCEARVVRARHFYASMSSGDDLDAPGPIETSFLGLELEGCPRASFAVAGVPITAHRVDARSAPAARSELAALIASRDAELEPYASLPHGGVRAFELPERELALVFGRGVWVIHRGELVLERFGGDPEVVVEAGPRTLFVMSSASESWMASLEDFAPPRADGSRRHLCFVEDPAGTPLNVRRRPSSDGEVLRTVTNGERVEILEERGSWRRIEGEPPGWVFGDALRCR